MPLSARYGRTVLKRRSIVATVLLWGLIGVASLPQPSRAATDSAAAPTSSQPQAAVSPAADEAGAAGGTAAAAPANLSTPALAAGFSLPASQRHAISANPGASNLLPGTGSLGRIIGFGSQSGIGLGGLWIGDADYLFTGGTQPRSWSFNSLFILNLNLDLPRLIGLPGSSIDASMLQFNGQKANSKAGVVQGYDGLTGSQPWVRTELYELWWRQLLFDDKLVLRAGKTVPTFDFNNVSKPISTSDETRNIPAVTGLIYTPIFVNPTLLGASPGYYNSAYGVTANIAPVNNFYFTYAFYDGALASGVQTGLKTAPQFNGHYFTIGEAGSAWLLGHDDLPGKFAVGGWAQTGTLHGCSAGPGCARPGVTQNGSQGFYSFGSQRIWFAHPDRDNSGVSGFFQFGFNDSNTMIANRYAGLGLTGFGLVPKRPVDSIGAGLAWSWLNRIYGFRSNEAMLQAYYQAHLIGTTFLQPTISYIPNPGLSPQIQGSVAMTAQLTFLF
jgi:porin